MTKVERMSRIIDILSSAEEPVSGAELAAQLSVSRQVIVTDMALIRANGIDIISTSRGYIIEAKEHAVRVFKVIHSDEDTEREMDAIVDLGGVIEDVFIYHKVYGIIRANMGIRNRRDVKLFMKDIAEGKSSYLKNAASGYHYHTISAESEEVLDEIMEELKKLGFLAELKEYEPVDFKRADKKAN